MCIAFLSKIPWSKVKSSSYLVDVIKIAIDVHDHSKVGQMVTLAGGVLIVNLYQVTTLRRPVVQGVIPKTAGGSWKKVLFLQQKSKQAMISLQRMADERFLRDKYSYGFFQMNEWMNETFVYLKLVQLL